MATDDATPAAVRVSIATPRPVLAEGMQILISDLGWSLESNAKKLADVVKYVKRGHPDLLLLDADWSAPDSLMTTVRMSTESLPETKVVLLYEVLEPAQRLRALLAGCTAILQCHKSIEQLGNDLLQINALPQPQPWGELGRLYQYLVHPVEQSSGCEHLSPRECQVLRLLGWGLSNAEIALALQLSIETVKEHVRRLFKKMGITDRAQAAVWAIRHGLVDFNV
jgi:DNA-binding NarL/FixJ family response regulator